MSVPGRGAGKGPGWEAGGARGWDHTPRRFCLVSEMRTGTRHMLTKAFGLTCPFSLLKSAEWGQPGSALCSLFLPLLPQKAPVPLPLGQRAVHSARCPLPGTPGQGRMPELFARRAARTAGTVLPLAGAGVTPSLGSAKWAAMIRAGEGRGCSFLGPWSPPGTRGELHGKALPSALAVP